MRTHCANERVNEMKERGVKKMGNEVGRAGFHVKHTKAVSERGAILDEMMRELKDESVERWAQRNPSIVVEDEHLNVALVNDGEGGFDPCSDPKQVIAYGNDRIGKLSSPIRDPKLDPVTGKLKGGICRRAFVRKCPIFILCTITGRK